MTFNSSPSLYQAINPGHRPASSQRSARQIRKMLASFAHHRAGYIRPERRWRQHAMATLLTASLILNPARILLCRPLRRYALARQLADEARQLLQIGANTSWPCRRRRNRSPHRRAGPTAPQSRPAATPTQRSGHGAGGARDRWPEAETLYKRALALNEHYRHGTRQHTEVASNPNTLGLLYLENGIVCRRRALCLSAPQLSGKSARSGGQPRWSTRPMRK